MTEQQIPDLWWSPSMARFLSRHEDQDDEHLVWVWHGHHESLRHYLGTGLDSNPPMPADAVRLIAASPAPSADGPASVVDRIAGLCANTNRRHMAFWLSQVAAAIREGREWPALEHKPVDDSEAEREVKHDG